MQQRTKNIIWGIFLIWALGLIVVLIAGLLFDNGLVS
jgi:hypothetical protein